MDPAAALTVDVEQRFASGFTVRATLDADLTYPADRLPDFLAALESGRADFVSGERLSHLAGGAMSGEPGGKQGGDGEGRKGASPEQTYAQLTAELKRRVVEMWEPTHAELVKK